MTEDIVQARAGQEKGYGVDADHHEKAEEPQPFAKPVYQEAQLKSTFDTLSIWKCAWTFRKTALIAGLAGFTAVTDGKHTSVPQLKTRVPIPDLWRDSGQHGVQAKVLR